MLKIMLLAAGLFSLAAAQSEFGHNENLVLYIRSCGIIDRCNISPIYEYNVLFRNSGDAARIKALKQRFIEKAVNIAKSRGAGALQNIDECDFLNPTQEPFYYINPLYDITNQVVAELNEEYLKDKETTRAIIIQAITNWVEKRVEAGESYIIEVDDEGESLFFQQVDNSHDVVIKEEFNNGEEVIEQEVGIEEERPSFYDENAVLDDQQGQPINRKYHAVTVRDKLKNLR